MDSYIYIYIYRIVRVLKSGWYVVRVLRHVLIWVLTIFVGLEGLQKPAKLAYYVLT